MVTRHSSIVGSTGCGKSTTVAGLLNSISDKSQFPSARILVLDIHGEYSKALGDRARVFKVGADSSKNENELQIPFWALNFEEMTKFAFGSLDNPKYATISDWVIKLKRESLENQPIKGIDSDAITVDSPTPFCLHKFWYELYKKDFMTIIPSSGGAADEVEPASTQVLSAEFNNGSRYDYYDVPEPVYEGMKTAESAGRYLNSEI